MQQQQKNFQKHFLGRNIMLGLFSSLNNTVNKEKARNSSDLHAFPSCGNSSDL